METLKERMPLSEIRRILERGEWWDNVRDVSPDEPRPWLDELNGAIDAALDELQAYHDAEADGRLVRLPVQVGQTVFCPYKKMGFVAYFCVEEVAFSKNGTTITLSRIGDSCDIRYIFTENIGQTFFLDFYEAEAALKEWEVKE